MRVAAIQMTAELGNVKVNLKSVKQLATNAFKEGAELVILPEFFTSAVAFHPKMLDVVRPINGEPTQLLNQLAKKYNGIIISMIKINQQCGKIAIILVEPMMVYSKLRLGILGLCSVGNLYDLEQLCVCWIA